MAAAPFFFQILLPSWAEGRSDLIHSSVVVEVVPTMVPGAIVSGDKQKTERELAEGEARRAAAEVSRDEYKPDSDPTSTVAQIGALPDEIGERPPTLQRAGVRAWLL